MSPIGEVLGDRFRIDRLVGTGGMSTVYQATDVALGRTVALKLFRVDSTDAADPERQSGEVAVLASLNHPSLVTLFDAGTAVIEGVPRTFIVMEFVDGTDLNHHIAQGPLPPREVAEIGADLAEALHYVHSRGIIHRDIKPGNVLLSPSDFPGRVFHAKLADFGIARLLDSTRLTATGALLGTASYLSPEQAQGLPLTSTSDVYSLGLVLLECLTGERAYPGTAIESAMARLQRQPEMPDDLGPEWTEVLQWMTMRDPAKRARPEQAAMALRYIAQSEAGAEGDAVPTRPTEALSGADLSTVAMPTHGDDVPEYDETVTRAFAARGLLAETEPVATPVGATRATTAARLHTDDEAPAPSTMRRNLIAIAAALVLLVATAAIILGLQPRETAPEGPPPSYPAVEGTLGTHLKQLQESVEP
jgi:serine/threonine protein kinase